jgi:hypothetical protein
VRPGEAACVGLKAHSQPINQKPSPPNPNPHVHFSCHCIRFATLRGHFHILLVGSITSFLLYALCVYRTYSFVDWSQYE